LLLLALLRLNTLLLPVVVVGERVITAGEAVLGVIVLLPVCLLPLVLLIQLLLVRVVTER
jgi:hypothetical protein